MDEVPGATPAMMADNMLGTLAKWLRVAGADCEYAGGMDDDDLVGVALGGRLVLTRDRMLAQRCGPWGLYVPSDDLEEQLLQVLRRYPGLMEREPLNRCLVCNRPVEVATAEEVADLVPGGVRERHREFWLCRSCGKAYWSGSHVDDMLSRLAALMERARE